jgi:hypothetical protein
MCGAVGSGATHAATSDGRTISASRVPRQLGGWRRQKGRHISMCGAPNFWVIFVNSYVNLTCHARHLCGMMGRRRECTQICSRGDMDTMLRRLVFSPVVFADPSFSRERGERGGRKYGTRDTYYSRFVVNHRMVSLNSALVSTI